MSATQRLRSYWERRAKTFDAFYDSDGIAQSALNAIFRRALRRRLEIAVDECRAARSGTVLDVGCGSGRGSVAIAENGAARVVGIDLAEDMLGIARRHARDQGVADKCEFTMADFLTHDFKDKFDCVVALGVFDYVDDPVPFLRRMMDLARKKVVFSVRAPSILRDPWLRRRYGRHGVAVYCYDRRGLEQLMARAGLSRTRIHSTGPGYVGIGDLTPENPD